MSRPVVLLAAVGAFLLGCAASDAAPSATRVTGLTVVAAHLNNPRKIFIANDGSVYVVEAGTGGRANCIGTGAARTCIGLSGSITRLRNGIQQRVVTGLWSGAHVDGAQAEGAADALLRNGRYYVLMQDAAVDSHGINNLGPDAVTAGDLVATKAGKAAPVVLADLAAFEARNNPDHGAGSGAKLGNPAIDSDPYAFVPYRGGFAVVDAAANDLLWINPAGKISVLAVFPTRIEPLSRAVGRRIGAPGTQTSILTQAVPSSVTVGPDGALYVGELTGVPFKPGTARVWRSSRGRRAPSSRRDSPTSRISRSWARTCSSWRWPPRACTGRAHRARSSSLRRAAGARPSQAPGSSTRRGFRSATTRSTSRTTACTRDRAPGRMASCSGSRCTTPDRGRRLRCDDAAAHRRRHDRRVRDARLTVGRDRDGANDIDVLDAVRAEPDGIGEHVGAGAQVHGELCALA